MTHLLYFRSTNEHLAPIPQTHFSHSTYMFLDARGEEWRFSTITVAISFILLTQIPERTVNIHIFNLENESKSSLMQSG